MDCLIREPADSEKLCAKAADGKRERRRIAEVFEPPLFH
jgi:hypothetical protein